MTHATCTFSEIVSALAEIGAPTEITTGLAEQLDIPDDEVAEAVQCLRREAQTAKRGSKLLEWELHGR